MRHALKRAVVALTALSFSVLAGSIGHSTGWGPEVSNFTLANGLDVVVIPDRRTPVITHMVWYRVGAADETPGKSGLAHFLEHLLFKGTKKNPQGLFSQTVATIGGSENAFTSSDYTGYFQRTSRDRLKLMMEFESDRMTNLVLTDDVVKPELQVVLEERNSRVENNVNARLVRADGSRALPEPSLWPAGDRLAPRDRRAHARRRAGVLQALLHAQQRDPHRRRRRLAGRSEGACRGNLRPCSARRRGETARAVRRSRSRKRRAPSPSPTRASPSRA